MNTIITVILAAYLICSSYTDIRKFTISAPLSVFTGILMVVLQIGYGAHVLYILQAITPGLFLLLIARITGQAVGYGDGIVFLVLGIGIGFSQTLILLCFSFILSALFSLYLITRHKPGKYTLPFVPFILAGYLISFVINN